MTMGKPPGSETVDSPIRPNRPERGSRASCDQLVGRDEEVIASIPAHKPAEISAESGNSGRYANVIKAEASISARRAVARCQRLGR